jgi:hypothetical protein
MTALSAYCHSKQYRNFAAQHPCNFRARILLTLDGNLKYFSRVPNCGHSLHVRDQRIDQCHEERVTASLIGEPDQRFHAHHRR